MIIEQAAINTHSDIFQMLNANTNVKYLAYTDILLLVWENFEPFYPVGFTQTAQQQQIQR